MTENTSRRPALLTRAKALPPWTLLAAGALAGGLAGGAYGALKPPVYTATAYVVAVPAEKSDPSSALGFAQAYGRVATQLAVLGDAQVWAGVPVDTLRKSVQTATSPDAPMVSITATSGRADLAADMANAVSRALTQHAKGSEKTTNVELQQFARALKPTDPSSQSPAVTGLVGASAGGLLGGLVLLARPKRGTKAATRTSEETRAPEETRAAEKKRTAEETRTTEDAKTSVPGPALAADVHGAR
ncbi:lipopolysaccharide biosynthesis protein [Streptomyces niveiscabiei]|uniref:lipopolysaccharide biosynthesis protein n=1 Tax=Streptomyces niveiscabiei TaxID=164115 RepID=UPI0029B47F6B|nr:lipopolysaccharide biosynthesis protein [Streptomyces niveiscabiei]MDX3383449.1 lipopolysaccharide biosynthesis protein [Streptomyces niveiscabiei]